MLMKTRTNTPLLLLVTLTCLAGSFSKQPNVPAVKETQSRNLNNRTCKSNASFCRSFMPYAEDPCNHLPSRKSFC